MSSSGWRAQADVVVDSYPPGHMDSIGLGYEAISKESPGLVMVSITPFGQSGPYSDYQSTDLTALAFGGPFGAAATMTTPFLRCEGEAIRRTT